MGDTAAKLAKAASAVTGEPDDGEQPADQAPASAPEGSMLGRLLQLGLNPALGHVVMYEAEPYVTRDGWLFIAHQGDEHGGRLDGIEVVGDVVETDEHWIARASVWRSDASHPFTYPGRYPRVGKYRRHGPEMAVKCAEVASLRRAFPVAGARSLEESWDVVVLDDLQTTDDEPEQPDTAAEGDDKPGGGKPGEPF